MVFLHSMRGISDAEDLRSGEGNKVQLIQYFPVVLADLIQQCISSYDDKCNRHYLLTPGRKWTDFVGDTSSDFSSLTPKVLEMIPPIKYGDLVYLSFENHQTVTIWLGQHLIMLQAYGTTGWCYIKGCLSMPNYGSIYCEGCSRRLTSPINRIIPLSVGGSFSFNYWSTVDNAFVVKLELPIETRKHIVKRLFENISLDARHYWSAVDPTSNLTIMATTFNSLITALYQLGDTGKGEFRSNDYGLVFD